MQQAMVQTEEGNAVTDMQKWLQLLAMMKKNKMGFWGEGNVSPQTMGGISAVNFAKSSSQDGGASTGLFSNMIR